GAAPQLFEGGQFLLVAELSRRLDHFTPTGHLQIAQPAHGGGPHAQRRQVFLGVAAAGAQHPELGERLWVAALTQTLPLRLAPQSPPSGAVFAARSPHWTQQRQRRRKVAAPVLPECRRADTGQASQFARRAGPQLQPSDELLQGLARAGIETA